MKYQHVIWDWNGTLLDDSRLCLDVMNNLLRRRDMPLLTWERYLEIFGFPVEDYYRRAGFDFAEESFADLGTEFMDEYNARVFESQLHADTTATLKHLNEANISQGILSAYQQDSLEKALDYYQIREYFGIVMGIGDHYASGKLERGFEMLEQLTVAPEQAVLIGDTVHDYDVATQIGVGSILVSTGSQSENKLAECEARVVSSLTEVVTVLEESS